MEFSSNAMLALADHREAACKAVKPCKFCGSEQVQLTRWLEAVCHVKCRECAKRDTFPHPTWKPE